MTIKSGKDYQVIVFDVDGTLFYFREHVSADTIQWMPNVETWFKDHPDQVVTLLSNQGGVGLQYWMSYDEDRQWGNPEMLPDSDDAIHHLDEVVKHIQDVNGRKVEYYTCFAYQSPKSLKWAPTPYYINPESPEYQRWDHTWRKPDTGMLRQILIDFDVEPEQVLVVGDGDEDRMCAERMNVDFIHANEFFDRTDEK